MPFRYRLEILVIIAILAFGAIFLYMSSFVDIVEYKGSDIRGSEKIAELTNKTEEDYPPLIRQWTPPSGEIESALFALQAAMGGLIVGWVFGYWKGQKKTV